MVKIKITAGIFFHNHQTVRAGDPAIEVGEAIARRLVEEKRAAEYVGAPVEDELPAGVVEIPEYSVEMKADKLREIGALCGLTFKVGMTKAEMVAALDKHIEENLVDGVDVDDIADAPTFDATEAVE